jgi:hypothetical protein
VPLTCSTHCVGSEKRLLLSCVYTLVGQQTKEAGAAAAPHVAAKLAAGAGSVSCVFNQCQFLCNSQLNAASLELSFCPAAESAHVQSADVFYLCTGVATPVNALCSGSSVYMQCACCFCKQFISRPCINCHHFCKAMTYAFEGPWKQAPCSCMHDQQV